MPFNREPTDQFITSLDQKGIAITKNLQLINKTTSISERLKWIRQTFPTSGGPIGRGSADGPVLGEIIDHHLMDRRMISENKSVVVELRHDRSGTPMALIATEAQAFLVVGRASGDPLPLDSQGLKNYLDQEKTYREKLDGMAKLTNSPLL